MARLHCALILLVSCLSLKAWAQQAPDGGAPAAPQPATPAAPQPATPAAPAADGPQPAAPSSPKAQGQTGTFLDHLPFIPVPEIDIDPNSGTTLGLIPTWLETDDNGEIKQIIAPDIINNPYFGWGARGRIFAYPSEDTQWSIVGGAKQRVESEFDALLETGRLRNGPWSVTLETTYDRSGTPRFYGFGNNSTIFNQSVYTNQQMYARFIAGYNITHKWQVAYMFEPRKVKILGARLQGIPSLTQKLQDLGFEGLLGLGVTHEMLSRVIVTYDTRDDVTVPTHGQYVRSYGGVAGRSGVPDDSLFSEAGVDASSYWTAGEATWASHLGLRYMPTTNHTPFWALSSLGGDTNELGDSEPLRGYGTGRFYDRESLDMNLEYRREMLATDFSGTHIDVQITPFVDAGRVFHNPSDFPLDHLHPVAGLGFRAIARPSVVGYVDFGVGSEGLAIFTGINYPF
jgi:hypothetical protein